MSILTKICYFTTEPLQAPEQFILPVLQFLGARQDLTKVTREAETRNWDTRNNRQLWITARRDILMEARRADEIAALYRKDWVSSVVWFGREEGLRAELRQQVLESIPEQLRQDHFPTNSDLSAGWHDIIGSPDNTDNEEYFGRASFSVDIWGYRAPIDIVRYRDSVLALPASRHIKAGLENILKASVESRVFMNL